MRKYLAIVLSVMFVLSIAATAFAIHAPDVPEEAVVAQGPAKITLGGKILIRGWYLDNVAYFDRGQGTTSNLPMDTDSQAMYTTNANITMDVNVMQTVRGFMELETSCFGSSNCGLYYWGNPSGYDSKPQADLLFRQLWVMYTGSGLLGVPAGIKAGHMPLSIGNKQFVNNERFGDDAIVVWVDPTKELHIAAATVKIMEGAYNNHTDDVNAYALLGTYAWDKTNTIGLNWVYVQSDGNTPSLDFAIPNIDKMNVHNVGIHANGDLSGFTYNASFDWQFGKVHAILPPATIPTWPSTANSLKAKGWGALLELGYMVDPVNIRLAGAMGSGDKDGLNDGDVKEFQTLMGPDEIGPFTRLVHYTQIYERTIDTTAQYALLTSTVGGNVRNTGIANTTYLNLGLDWAATPAINLSLDYFYLRATEVPTNSGWSKSAGSELDFKGTYQIAKNLSYFVEAAGFWAGGYYEDAYGIEKKNVTQLVHGLLLKF